MKTFNREWTRMNANKVERASRSFKQAGHLLYIVGMLYCTSASAQTAMELFNPAAKEYIYNNTPAASNLVTKALQQFPEDEKLLKLKELINQQQKKNEQQKQDSEDKKDEQQKQEQQQEKQDQEKPADKSDSSDQSDQKQDQQQQQPAQPQQQAGEMSKEEAQQLLDAMKQNEKDQREKLHPVLGRPVRVEKDW